MGTVLFMQPSGDVLASLFLSTQSAVKSAFSSGPITWSSLSLDSLLATTGQEEKIGSFRSRLERAQSSCESTSVISLC